MWVRNVLNHRGVHAMRIRRIGMTTRQLDEMIQFICLTLGVVVWSFAAVCIILTLGRVI